MKRKRGPRLIRPVSVLLPIALFDAIAEAAKPEQRTVGAQIRKVLVDWVASLKPSAVGK